jgi:hypothetical protein
MTLLPAAILALALVLCVALVVASRILLQRTAQEQVVNPPPTPSDAAISDLKGQIAAIERRQSDLEGEVGKKLARASARQRRAEAALDEGPEGPAPADDLVDPSQMHLPVPETPGTGHATIEQVRARARARKGT